VAVALDGEIVTAEADVEVDFLSPTGETRDAVDASPMPILSLAIAGNGERVAATTICGSVAIIDRRTRTLAGTLVGPGMPVWSVAFFPDNRMLLTGGAHRMIRRWDSEAGEPIGSIASGGVEDPLTAYADDPGAQVFRACIAGHTL
jgi:cytochrome c